LASARPVEAPVVTAPRLANFSSGHTKEGLRFRTNFEPARPAIENVLYEKELLYLGTKLFSINTSTKKYFHSNAPPARLYLKYGVPCGLARVLDKFGEFHGEFST
jgi:hypothetical protein